MMRTTTRRNTLARTVPTMRTSTQPRSGRRKSRSTQVTFPATNEAVAATVVESAVVASGTYVAMVVAAAAAIADVVVVTGVVERFEVDATVAFPTAVVDDMTCGGMTRAPGSGPRKLGWFAG